jgi:hypothetical protein
LVRRRSTNRDVANIPYYGQSTGDPLAVIDGAFGLGKLQQRSPIWVVALTGSDEISIVHDDCVTNVTQSGEASIQCDLRGM